MGRQRLPGGSRFPHQDRLLPQPTFAYESSFAIKRLIEDRFHSVPEFNHDPNPVVGGGA
jgi:hypothetical protein